ncbi:transcriptional regulator NrdR [Liquorilactobacillus uvarum]|uniref:transcriptional regulator NrdR n=1 Tax=Liquorilactobacillus uvarum TaxID=303240 RepID=UPI002889F900|nr:transcriptional regulator NrdR [Liquorilactobacillus uvarum]
MRCPHCHHNGSRVVDSRPADDGHVIRRRRECEACGFRFTTFERVEATPLLVIKKNGTREEFNREKILRGVIRSAEKRPVGMDEITRIVDEVENKVRSLGENEVSSQLVGEYVMGLLADVDEISYIRFASVYRQFKDMSVFLKELQEMMARDKKSKNNEDSKKRTADDKKK